MKRSETSPADNPGREFGPYTLVRRLGVGGMAETFVAEMRGPGGSAQWVCLKTLLPSFRDDPDYVAAFEHEAQLMARLQHRNIVGVIDFGGIEDTPYIALELVDGLDLRRLLDAQKGKRLSTECVTLLGLELAGALEHIHDPSSATGTQPAGDEGLGFVHCDISPSNVLISRQGEILLTDFGIASRAIPVPTTSADPTRGKLFYMSPEQIRVEPLDGRSDLFALGVVMFEALSGRCPFKGPHAPATIGLIVRGEHPSLSALVPDAPLGLCRIVEKLLEPDRDKRPSNAAEVIELLAEFAPPPSARRQLGALVAELRTEFATESEIGLSESQLPTGKVGASEVSTPVPPASSVDVAELPSSEPLVRAESAAPRSRGWLSRFFGFRKRSGVPRVDEQQAAEELFQEVSLGASAPASVPPGGEFTIRLAAYVLARKAEAMDALRAGSQRAVAHPNLGRARWKEGIEVTVLVRGTHLEIDPPVQQFRWSGALDTLVFDARVATDAPNTTVVLRYDVIVEGARVAALRHDLEIRPGAVVGDVKEITATPARTAFASYASEDRDPVLHRVAALRIGTGMDIFQDCLSLRPGEEWKPALSREIRNRDLFLLFWSSQAAKSPWVEWEWTTALDVKGQEGLQIHPLEPLDESAIPQRLLHLHLNDPTMIIRAYYQQRRPKT